MNEVYILFGSSIAVMFLAIVTFFVVVNYHKTLKQQRELEEEVKKMRSQGSEEARKLILDAQIRATEVIKNAELKAQELLRANFQNSLEKESIKMLSSISQTINSQIDAEVNGLHKAMVEETAKARDSFAKSMAGAYTQAQAQVDEYKKIMIDRVNSVIFSIIQSVAKKVIAESLDKNQHEKLIIRALEEAKKQNVL